MDDYILVDNQSSISDQNSTIENPCSTQERPATLPDIPNLHFNHTIVADKPEQRAILPDISDKAIAADVEEQPRAITWSDIKIIFLGPQVIFALLHIPTLLHPWDLISYVGILRPWTDTSDELCEGALIWLTEAIFFLLLAIWTHWDDPDNPPFCVYQPILPFLWQLLVAFHLESIELSSWWWREMVMWGAGVAGGHLLLLALDVWAGEYAWPQASQEERRQALEAAHLRDPEKGGDQDHGGKWITMEEVTDQFIAEVFTRPCKGFWAALYFFNSTAIFVPVLVAFGTFCYILYFESPWQGNQLLAFILYFVALLWVVVMAEAAIVLRELPRSLPDGPLDDIQRGTMLGGENTRNWRMKRVVYESEPRVEYHWVK